MAKRRPEAVAGRPVARKQRGAPPPPAPRPAVETWEWPVLAALTLAPIAAGGLEELPAFCLDALVFLALLLRLARPPDLFALLPRAFKLPALALAALGLLSLAVSVYRYATVATWLHWSAWLALAALCADMARAAGGRERVVGALLLGSAYVVVRGMQEYLFAAFRQGIGNWRTFSTFFSPNLLAAYLESLIPLTLAVCLHDRRRPVALLTGFLVALQVATLLVTGSRGGLLALAAGMVVMGLVMAVRRLRPTRVELARAGAVIAVTLPLLAVAGGPITNRILRSRAAAAATATGAAPAGGAEAHSNQFRLLTWQSTLRMVQSRPVTGYGLGTWRYAHPQHAIAGFTRMAHQSYLQLASETGLPGLIAFLALLGATALALLRARTEERAGSWLGAGVAGGIAAAAAHNMLDYSWYIYGTAATFWALVGLAWSPALPAPAELRGHPGRGAALVTAGAVLALAVWLGMAASYQARAQASLDLLRGGAGTGGGPARLQEAEAAARTAAALNPLNAEPHLLLGTIYRSRGRLPEAVEAYQAAARRAPTYAIAHYRRGETLTASGDLSGAIAAYREGLRHDPNSTQLLAALARAQQAAGRPAEARATYERLLAVARGPAGTITALEQMRDPRPAEAHRALGRDAEAAGRLAEAVEHYRAAATLLQARRRDMLAGSLAVMEAAGQLSPPEESRWLEMESELWAKLAELYQRLGNAAEAEWAREQGDDAAQKQPRVRGSG